ncbi:outer membrane beta-barrel protein [Bradyrhizobium sp. NBAIM01]|uniref:outer membrane protein n=1 Tax=Bradyrhizobium sp. NBAIM01 TaxID=2793818 RepID=UPI001CD4B0CE|nr:outer membrane beta-barrel protein [Bradyrhizobium sp. NBAIM01]MCA1510208.1 porin family protein [Bradyrhizobium sp. NBAIM01]
MKRNKKMSLAGLIVCGTIAFWSGSLAADLLAAPFVQAPAPAPPLVSWTGGYIGGSVGSGWGTSQTDLTVGNTFIGAPVSQTVNQLIGGAADLHVPLPQVQMNGFLGGVQAGYNFQSGVLVYGVEGDFLWSGIKGRNSCFVALNCTNDTKWIADITGRVGVTVGDGGLVYIKGGAAWADSGIGINQSFAVTSNLGTGFAANGAADGRASKNIFGGTLGAGIEYAFLHGWSAKIEYDYFDFGRQDVTLPVSVAGGVNTGDGAPGPIAIGVTTPVSFKQELHTIRVGVNYHF